MDLHSHRTVIADRAVDVVRARLQRDGEARRLARLDDTRGAQIRDAGSVDLDGMLVVTSVDRCKGVGARRLAEDIAQQAFERARRYAALYDPRRGSVRTWLTRIVHNLAVDAVRVRRPAPIDPQDLLPLIAAMTDTPERRVLAGETAAQLRSALATLPQEAVVMAAMQGLTAREIAEIESIPVGTAKSRIRAAMTKLHAS